MGVKGVLVLVLVLVLVPWDIPVGAAGGVLRRKPRSGGAARGGGECGENDLLLEGERVAATLCSCCSEGRESVSQSIESGELWLEAWNS